MTLVYPKRGISDSGRVVASLDRKQSKLRPQANLEPLVRYGIATDNC